MTLPKILVSWILPSAGTALLCTASPMHTSMNTLLSLPRELRDQIIEYVVLSRIEPPLGPSHEVQLSQDVPVEGALRLPKKSSRTYNATGLLGANGQLRDETQDCLSHLKLTYSLDVMVVNNELWPTWTCCPFRAPGAVDAVDVSLRFFNKPNDPFMVHVARTFWAILQGRKWTSSSMHPLAELFLHIHEVCLQPGSKDTNIIKDLCFNASMVNCLDGFPDTMLSGSLSNLELKQLFGKHRSLWNSFRSIHQYPFSSNTTVRRLEPLTSLKIMVILILQDSWEDECAIYTSYVGPLGAAFRGVRRVRFAVDGHDLGQLTSRVLST